MRKEFFCRKFYKKRIITVLSIILLLGVTFYIPNYVIGSNKIELKASPTDKSIQLVWASKKLKVDKYLIQKSVGTDTYEIEVPASKENYEDLDVLPRLEYNYKVIAIGKGKKVIESNNVENIILVKADNPHGMYSSTTSLCRVCHIGSKDNKDELIGQNELCFSCHSEVEKEFNQKANNLTVHPVIGDKAFLQCSSCHNAHEASTPENPKILEVLFQTREKDFFFKGDSGDAFCLTCHDGNGGSTRVIDKEIYLDGSAHSNLNKMKLPGSGSKITCNSCHAQHASKYNNLLRFEFNPESKKSKQDNNQLCFTCHGQESDKNIHKYFNGSTDGENKGHYINNSELAKKLGVTIGWQLSCSDCHSQHGSTNSKMITENLGDFTKIKDSIDRERAICTSCHAYANDKGVQSAFRGVSFSALPGSVDQHRSTDEGEQQSCTSCHSKNNSVAGAHAPKSGLTPKPPKTEDKPSESEEPKVEEPAKEPVSTDDPKTETPDESVNDQSKEDSTVKDTYDGSANP